MAHVHPSSSLHLTKLSIRNFRGIDDLELNLTDGTADPLDVVVLGGGNGSGKTSVLEAVILLLNLPELLPDDAAPLPEQVRFGADAGSLAGAFRWKPESDAEPADFGGRLSLERVRRDHQPVVLIGSMRMSPGLDWVDAPDFLPNIEYFSSRREPEQLGTVKDPQGVRSLTEGRRLVELKRRLISTFYRSLRSPGAPAETSSPFERLQRFWSRFAGPDEILDVIPVSNDPGSGDEVVLRDRRPIPADVTSLAAARELSPKREDIPRLVPLDRLSSGQIALFAFAGPLIFRDAPAHLILIDEPEQHLHVQWQRLLLPALRDLSPGSQFLIATHSVDILESVLSYERFLLVEDGDPRAVADRSTP